MYLCSYSRVPEFVWQLATMLATAKGYGPKPTASPRPLKTPPTLPVLPVLAWRIRRRLQALMHIPRQLQGEDFSVADWAAPWMCTAAPGECKSNKFVRVLPPGIVRNCNKTASIPGPAGIINVYVRPTGRCACKKGTAPQAVVSGEAKGPQ